MDPGNIIKLYVVNESKEEKAYVVIGRHQIIGLSSCIIEQRAHLSEQIYIYYTCLGIQFVGPQNIKLAAFVWWIDWMRACRPQLHIAIKSLSRFFTICACPHWSGVNGVLWHFRNHCHGRRPAERSNSKLDRTMTPKNLLCSNFPHRAPPVETPNNWIRGR